jgi:hypothetical protein
MNDETPEVLSPADLTAIRQSRRAAELAIKAAELPTALARAASAEAKVVHLETAAKYQLGPKDKLDLDTGAITRARPPAPTPEGTS